MAETNFDGFGKDALPFLKALEFHQDRNWFKENRHIYERELEKPFLNLLQDAGKRLQEAGIELTANGKSSLFRIHRDVRFSKDKRPYNSRVSGVLTRTGTKKDIGGIYMHFEPGNCFLASGLWFPKGPVLKAMRDQIVTRQSDFLATCADLEEHGLPIGDNDMVSRTPAGFKNVTDERLLYWLRHKSFIVQRMLEEEALHSALLVDAIVDFGKKVLPLMNFIWCAVDPVREEIGNA